MTFTFDICICICIYIYIYIYIWHLTFDIYKIYVILACKMFGLPVITLAWMHEIEAKCNPILFWMSLSPVLQPYYFTLYTYTLLEHWAVCLAMRHPVAPHGRRRLKPLALMLAHQQMTWGIVDLRYIKYHTTYMRNIFKIKGHLLNQCCNVHIHI